MQDCSNSMANVLELLQSCTKPLIYLMSFLNCEMIHAGFSFFISGLLKCCISVKPFWCWDKNIQRELDQYHGCWCPRFLRLQPPWVTWVIIGLRIGVLSVDHHSITWTNVDLLWIAPSGTNLIEIQIKLQNFFLTLCGLVMPYGDRHLG